ncbi:Alpha/beta-hydrolase [Mycena indigotica]|uniref:Alpha/beta-hydrolase n=1 Tax=Mycena indigotica TaxID=2126181 RepID=A0A8H6SMN0_9AGAR|nr:Alpha/beta-hydrolase [Mycena indigotica]KAF7301032.1 Alpha/beta-hydrolase [Mycena indigotica]
MVNLAILSALFLLFQASSATTFNPRAYTKNLVTCKARNRAEEKDVDINIHYVDINQEAKTTLLMVHGWPSLWSTWSNQIQEFQACSNEYRLVVPDLRGFGESTHPGDVKSSGTMDDMVRDMVCVLENAGVTSAVCLGHDWGSQICYTAARMRPDIFTGVVGIAVPYLSSSGAFTPIKHLVSSLPTLSYQIYFNERTAEAVAELAKDIRRTTRATLRSTASSPPKKFLRSTTSFLDAWADVADIPPVPFFSPDEEDYFVEQYSIQKFENTLQFYTEENRKLTWQFAQEQGNHTPPTARPVPFA